MAPVRFASTSNPNGEEVQDHAGIDALMERIGEAEVPNLRGKYQNINAVSLLRRRKPVPEPLRSAIVARDGDDVLILKQRHLEYFRCSRPTS